MAYEASNPLDAHSFPYAVLKVGQGAGDAPSEREKQYRRHTWNGDEPVGSEREYEEGQDV